jgi:predicted dehydrogenase
VIRIGVLGLGGPHASSSRRGTSLLRQLRGFPGVRVEAVCDLDPGALDRARREFEVPAAFTAIDDFLQAPLDAVVVATPAPLHAAHAIAALRAGLHVACEVPAACTLQECAALAAAGRASRRLYSMLENYRYFAFIESWRAMVEGGLLGAPVYGEGEYVHDLRWQFAAPDGSRAWRGAFPPLQYGTHALGPLLHVFGDRCVRATALGTGPRLDPGAPVSDLEVALFQLAGGGVLKVLCGFAVAREPKSCYYSVYGTKGFVETERELEAGHPESTRAYLEAMPHARGLARLPVGSDLPRPHGPVPAWGAGSYPSRDHFALAQFVAAVRDGVPPDIGLERSLEFTAPCICAHRSAECGGAPVEVPDFRLPEP